MSKKEDIIIVGTGGHAKCVVDVIEHENKYNIIGFTVKEEIPEKEFLGYPILGTDAILPDLLQKGVKNAAVGVGGYRNNNLRVRIFEKLKEIGFNLPSFIHPFSFLSKRVQIGEANIILAGVVLDIDVVLGQNIILGTGATISHGSSVGNHSLISAGVTIGGDCVIGNNVLCALGSKIISGVKVNDHILIGAGAVAVKNLEREGIYIGIPAKLKNG